MTTKKTIKKRARDASRGIDWVVRLIELANDYRRSPADSDKDAETRLKLLNHAYNAGQEP